MFPLFRHVLWLMNLSSVASGTFLRSLTIRWVTGWPCCPLGECWKSAHLFRGDQGSHVVSAASSPPASCHIDSSPHLQPGSAIPKKIDGSLRPMGHKNVVRKWKQYLTTGNKRPTFRACGWQLCEDYLYCFCRLSVHLKIYQYKMLSR